MKVHLAFAPLVFVITALSARVAHAEDKPIHMHPRVALVLEGGGALGFAHVGVIKVLEEAHIPVDFVAGTSMGSIVGAAFASGATVKEMEDILSTTDWDALFNEAPPRELVNYRYKSGRGGEIYGDSKLGIKDGGFVIPSAVVQGQYVELLFHRLFGKASLPSNFEELPVPFRAVAADLETGQSVVLDHGSLPLAARASMSVPGFFAPVDLDGKLLVDGGITNNFPVDLALQRKPETIIAVAFNGILRKREQLESPLAISAQILDLLLLHSSLTGENLVRKQDIMIKPDLKDYGSTSFTHAREIMAAGEAAARAALPRLRKLSVPDAQFDAYYEHRISRPRFTPTIDYVRVEHAGPYRAAAIEKAIGVKVGEPLDPDKVEKALNSIYKNGELKKLTYTIEEKDGKRGLIINDQEKEWLNNYLRLGFALHDNFDGNSGFSLAADMRFNQLDTTGSYADLQLELGDTTRIFGEYYKPLAVGSPLFIAPSLELMRRGLTVRQDGEDVADYERRTGILGLDLGVSFGEYGELTSGWRRGPGRLDRRIGSPELPEFDYDVGEILTAFTLDQFDNVDFPTKGYRLSASSTQSRDGLGASGDFDQFRVNGGLPYTMGRTTVLVNGELGASSDDLPVERSYSLGGPFDISGFSPNELTADNYWIGRTAAYYRILEGSSALFQLGGYLGGTFEYSSLRTEIQSIGDQPGIVSGSIFIGADTPLVPVYFGFGMSNDQEKQLFFNLGRLTPRRR